MMGSLVLRAARGVPRVIATACRGFFGWFWQLDVLAQLFVLMATVPLLLIALGRVGLSAQAARQLVALYGLGMIFAMIASVFFADKKRGRR